MFGKVCLELTDDRSTVVSPVGASLPMETLVEPRTTVQLRHTSVPLPIRAPLTDLPTRNASLGRVLGDAAVKQSKQDAPPSSFRGYAQPGHRTEDVSQLQREAEIKARPVPSPASAIVGLPAVEDKHEAKGLRKEKTKSKVWSLFRGKKDRSSDVPTSELAHPRLLGTTDSPQCPRANLPWLQNRSTTSLVGRNPFGSLCQLSIPQTCYQSEAPPLSRVLSAQTDLPAVTRPSCTLPNHQSTGISMQSNLDRLSPYPSPT